MFWFEYIELIIDDVIVKGGRLIVEAENEQEAEAEMRSIVRKYNGIHLCPNIYGSYPTRKEAEEIDLYSLIFRNRSLVSN